MATILVCYYSRTQHTQHMAELIAKGAEEIEGTQVDLKSLETIQAQDLLNYEAIILGSPTYYGTMAAELKALLDESVAFHGQLEGRVGGAFSSSANVGGGNETTVMDILKALLIHGMAIQGSPAGDHYGPVAIGEPDNRAEGQCVHYGRMVARLAGKLYD